MPGKDLTNKTWDLDQALCWVAWRDSDIVNNAKPGSYFLNNLYPASTSPAKGIKASGTVSELHNALHTEGLKARGFRRNYIEGAKFNDADIREDIPTTEWSDLEICPTNPGLYNSEGGAFSVRTDRIVWSGLVFNSDEVKKIFPEDGSKKQPKKPGRPKGSGTIDDTALLKKMHKLLQDGTAKSPHNAAVQIVGGKDEINESIIRRLVNKYKKNTSPDLRS